MMPVGLFDLGEIYSERYSYSLPKKVLEDFGKGLGFPDNKVEYSPEEVEALRYDIMEIWDRIQSRKPEESKKIVLTAGAPGVGKTTLMRRLWDTPENKFAYICPDDVCLKEMETTYGAMVAKDSSPEGLKAAYNKWRAGSNYAHHLITAQLVKQHASFYFGTTASGDKTYLFLDFLKKRGYSIEILHISAPDQVRFDSIAKRDKVFVQVSTGDALNKQLMVHERIQDTFLKYADKIAFYFRDGVDNGAVLSATWIRLGDGKGTLEIVDQHAYEQMRTLHDKVCMGMNKPELQWANTVEKTL